MNNRRVLVSAAMAWVLFASQSTMAWQTPTRTRTLVVAGDVRTPLTLTVDDVKNMPRTTVEIKNESGGTLTYEGVLLGEILKRAGATLGAELRGDAVASYVVATAADGYRAVFSLGEVDPALTMNGIMIADTVDGKPLADNQGPFRVVTPKDSRPSRAVHMVERIDVVRLKK